MKLAYIITALLALAPAAVSAQTLAAPDDPAAMPEAPAAAPDSSATPRVQPQHNNPEESFRNERRFLHEGNTYFNDSNFYRALECYNKALEVNGASIAGRYNKAMALLRLANTDNAADQRPQAAQLLQGLIPDALEYDPEIARRAYYNLGNMAYNDQNYGGAIGMYESSLRLDPDHYDVRYNLRLAQLQQQNQDQDQNQDQNQDEQEQEQQQQQPEPMSQSAQQILQSMQNQENATRRRVQEEEEQGQSGRRQPLKPW